MKTLVMTLCIILSCISVLAQDYIPQEEVTRPAPRQPMKFTRQVIVPATMLADYLDTVQSKDCEVLAVYVMSCGSCTSPLSDYVNVKLYGPQKDLEAAQKTAKQLRGVFTKQPTKAPTPTPAEKVKLQPMTPQQEKALEAVNVA